MATVTLGTTANNSLTALQFSAGSGMLDPDVASIAQAIFDDVLGLGTNSKPARVVPGAFVRSGLLFIPNRGVLKVLPTDFVGVDTNSGWPILVSGNVIGLAGSPWVHT